MLSAFTGEIKFDFCDCFAMGAAESSVQRDPTSQEDASVSASAAELSAIQEGGGVLESKVQPDQSPPFIGVNLVANTVVYTLRLCVHTRNSPLDPVWKCMRVTLHVRNRRFLLSNGTSCLQSCSNKSSGNSSSSCSHLQSYTPPALHKNTAASACGRHWRLNRRTDFPQ